MGDFSTLLATPFALPGSWEVGLSEINIPGSFLNVSKDDAWFRVIKHKPRNKVVFEAKSFNELSSLKNPPFAYISSEDDFIKLKLKSHYMIKVSGNVLGLPRVIYGDKNRIYIDRSLTSEFNGTLSIYESATEESKVTIDSKHFTTIEEIIEEINNKAENMFKLVLENDMVVCNFSTVHVIQFSPQLGAILGYRNDSLQEKINRARFETDLTPGINAILVYTDCIEECYVGNVQAPLLRLLPRLNVKPNETMSYECFPIQYKKVLVPEISRIRIVLRDDTGRKLSFQGNGRVSLTLHFRKI